MAAGQQQGSSRVACKPSACIVNAVRQGGGVGGRPRTCLRADESALAALARSGGHRRKEWICAVYYTHLTLPTKRIV